MFRKSTIIIDCALKRAVAEGRCCIGSQGFATCFQLISGILIHSLYPQMSVKPSKDIEKALEEIYKADKKQLFAFTDIMQRSNRIEFVIEEGHSVQETLYVTAWTYDGDSKSPTASWKLAVGLMCEISNIGWKFQS